MKITGDFHIHSHYSIATSKKLAPENIDFWAGVKGIKVVGTGDFTHPGWLEELKEKLEPAEQGLYRLKKEYRRAPPGPGLGELSPVRFILTSEISNIYKKGEKVRKVHNLVFAPDFEIVQKIQQRLSKIGNITSDGRPILGLDSKDLLEITLGVSDKTFFVPSHIWTPWFSVLGSKSGFDSIEECYGDLAGHISTVETGLSSDPQMNWSCSFLDPYTLISNSDAHSPEKLGREANLFDTGLCYDDLIDAMKTGDRGKFLGTIEFFPQEGKYHNDGHRKCGVNWNPLETLKHNGICPVCGKKVTIGVMNRVAQLADREKPGDKEHKHPFYSIIPLKELLSEITGVGPGTKRVSAAYNAIIQKTVSEFDVLMSLSEAEIRSASNELLAEAVTRMRKGDVYIKEGFDGEYGKIQVFQEDEKRAFGRQDLLFAGGGVDIKRTANAPGTPDFDLKEYRKLKGPSVSKYRAPEKTDPDRQHAPPVFSLLNGLNPEQIKSVSHGSGPAVVLAGPGTGKTKILTTRIAELITRKGVSPENILAVTFTNKAAKEMKERLGVLLLQCGHPHYPQSPFPGDHSGTTKILSEGSSTRSSEGLSTGSSEGLSTGSLTGTPRLCTFHALGLSILTDNCEKAGRSKNFTIIDEEDRKLILNKYTGCEKSITGDVSESISGIKHALLPPDKIGGLEHGKTFNQYENILKKINAFDLDDLIYRSVQVLNLYPETLARYREMFRWIMVDEYQDVNYAQYSLIRTLMPGRDPNLFVIGDPDQAIYGFRGADVKFITKFINDFPGAPVFGLKKSYRCSNFILQASHQVIKSRPTGVNRPALEGLQEGIKIKIVESPTPKSEAEFVARTIEKMMGGLRFFSLDSDISLGSEEAEISSLSDFAVLCRVKEQMKVLEKAFNDHTIPYQKAANDSILKQEPVRSAVELLKLSLNPENSFLRGKLTQKGIVVPGEHHSGLDNPDVGTIPGGNPGIVQGTIPGGNPGIVQGAVSRMISRIITRFFCDWKNNSKAAFKQLIDLAEGFGDSLDDFIEFFDLGIDTDTCEKEVEKVSLMTLHAAKGLEFKCVFITGCENNLIPYTLFGNRGSDTGLGSESDFAEEKRLLYVGMTRAEKFLYLSRAEKRYIFGREYQFGKSPFLDSIENELAELSKSGRNKTPGKKNIQMDLF